MFALGATVYVLVTGWLEKGPIRVMVCWAVIVLHVSVDVTGFPDDVQLTGVVGLILV